MGGFEVSVSAQVPPRLGPIGPHRFSVQHLLIKVGMTPDEIGALSEEEAMARWVEWQASSKD